MAKTYEEIKKMTYSEFTQYVDDNGIENIIGYDDFEIYEIDGHYFYLETGENDASGFFGVECIATLSYNVENDIQTKDGFTLQSLFNCDCCGEREEENGNVEYMWFKELEINV